MQLFGDIFFRQERTHIYLVIHAPVAERLLI